MEHVVVWERAHGPIPSGMQVHHRTRTSSTTDSKTWNCLVRWFTSASIAAVSFVTESGGSHAANAENCDTSAIITNGSTAYLPGVSPAPSGTLFKISVTAGRSDHPTVKPEALMRWLVRLITPPGGLVLDPFTGSGSTGKAAVLEGFDFVGCELTPEYLPIANARIAAAVARAEQAQAAAPQYDMFDGAAA
ncbi:DNA methyltransferase [Sphingomonas paucimobilis]|uniref:DNA methyltransferase n=1 Tax=Sphingomonas paucimobilis TaxID=13689 RepID=UPI0009E3CDD0